MKAASTPGPIDHQQLRRAEGTALLGLATRRSAFRANRRFPRPEE
jgi:hypothetical protein